VSSERTLSATVTSSSCAGARIEIVGATSEESTRQRLSRQTSSRWARISSAAEASSVTSARLTIRK
jgi:hypothetical protein